MGAGISDRSKIAVIIVTTRGLYGLDDSAMNTAGETICPMALIPWPIKRKNPNLSKAFLAAVVSVIVRLLMKQTVMTRTSNVKIIGKPKMKIFGTNVAKVAVLVLFPVAAASQSRLILNTKNGVDSRIISIHTTTAVMMKYLVFLGASTGLCQHLTTTKTVKA